MLHRAKMESGAPVPDCLRHVREVRVAVVFFARGRALQDPHNSHYSYRRFPFELAATSILISSPYKSKRAATNNTFLSHHHDLTGRFAQGVNVSHGGESVDSVPSRAYPNSGVQATRQARYRKKEAQTGQLPHPGFSLCLFLSAEGLEVGLKQGHVGLDHFVG